MRGIKAEFTGCGLALSDDSVAMDEASGGEECNCAGDTRETRAEQSVLQTDVLAAGTGSQPPYLVRYLPPPTSPNPHHCLTLYIITSSS